MQYLTKYKSYGEGRIYVSIYLKKNCYWIYHYWLIFVWIKCLRITPVPIVFHRIRPIVWSMNRTRIENGKYYHNNARAACVSAAGRTYLAQSTEHGQYVAKERSALWKRIYYVYARGGGERVHHIFCSWNALSPHGRVLFFSHRTYKSSDLKGIYICIL